MSNEPSPLDAALDLLIYAPVGLALAMGEEVPKLAARGRQRLEGPLAAARLVGRLAVQQGRREADRWTAAAPARPRRPGTARPGGAGPDRAPTGDEPPNPPAEGPVVEGLRLVEDSGAGGGGGGGGTRPGPAAGRRTADDSDAPDPGSLAIPGYDSLSASQVVQRLAGLSAPELEAVRAYEEASRGRRTILARIAQLQSR